MPRSSDEKMLGANLPLEFVEAFWEQAAPPGTNKQLVITAMTQLWLSTPVEIRRLLLYPSETDDSFVVAVERIVEAKLTEYLSAYTEKGGKGKKSAKAGVPLDVAMARYIYATTNYQLLSAREQKIVDDYRKSHPGLIPSREVAQRIRDHARKSAQSRKKSHTSSNSNSWSC